MTRFFTRFLRHQQGVALIEFVIVFPFMFLLLFGGIELSRYILIVQRVEKAAYVLTDITAQFPRATKQSSFGEISSVQLDNNVFPQFHRVMGIYGDTAREGVIITSVIRRDAKTKLRWQRYIGGASLPGSDFISITTGIGPENTPSSVLSQCDILPFDAQINNELSTMLEYENMIVGEVYFYYQPIVASLAGVTASTGMTGSFFMAPRTIVRRIFLHPRRGALLHLPPGQPYMEGAC